MAAFRVPDMTCNHCVATITKALEARLPGAHPEIDLETKLVRVEGDSAAAAAAIADAGYSPEPVA
ncbi:MAG: heavy-metal-associated domain-containing protein [Rhodobacteraceae bacterium]|nr:heavy-metal-associated domain-containing protein [Paracoccaceae bacterium]